MEVLPWPFSFYIRKSVGRHILTAQSIRYKPHKKFYQIICDIEGLVQQVLSTIPPPYIKLLRFLAICCKLSDPGRLQVGGTMDKTLYVSPKNGKKRTFTHYKRFGGISHLCKGEHCAVFLWHFDNSIGSKNWNITIVQFHIISMYSISGYSNFVLA
jgi:hypothetical protein